MTTFTDAQQRDVDTIRDTGSWANWPILPLVRRPGTISPPWPDCGFIVAIPVEGLPMIGVWVGNLWDAYNVVSHPENFKEYESVEAIVEDGWRVD